MTIQLWQLLSVVGLILLALEAMTGTFVLLSLAIGCFATAAAFELIGVRSGGYLVIVFALTTAGSAFLLIRVLRAAKSDHVRDVSDY